MRPQPWIDGSLLVAAAALAAAPGMVPFAPYAPLGAIALLHVWGAAVPRSSYFLRVHWRLPPGCPGLALTFDDGPHPEITPRLLDLLAAAHQQATFFVIGEHVRAHGALLRRMLAEGHALGIHSDRHDRFLAARGTATVRRDLEHCAAAIADATGAAPPRLFRPPIGIKSPSVARAAAELGLSTITWSCRGLDGVARADPARVLARLARGIAPRAILTLHDGHEPGHPCDRSACLVVTEALLPRLRAAGCASRALVVARDEISLAEDATRRA